MANAKDTIQTLCEEIEWLRNKAMLHQYKRELAENGKKALRKEIEGLREDFKPLHEEIQKLAGILKGVELERNVLLGSLAQVVDAEPEKARGIAVETLESVNEQLL